MLIPKPIARGKLSGDVVGLDLSSVDAPAPLRSFMAALVKIDSGRACVCVWERRCPWEKSPGGHFNQTIEHMTCTQPHTHTPSVYKPLSTHLGSKDQRRADAANPSYCVANDGRQCGEQHG